MPSKEISTYYNEDKSRKAIIYVDLKACYYYAEFYDNNKLVETRPFFERSLRYAEDAAENYTTGIINVQQTA